MYITQTYKYRYNNIVYVGGNVPEGAEILETMDILNAEEGFELIRNSDKENIGTSVWLRNGNTQDNYTEVEETPESEME